MTGQPNLQLWTKITSFLN